MVELGGLPAFPTCLSRNELAAHFAPDKDNLEIFTEKDVVKVDLGAHIDGFISDAAITIDLSGKYGKLVEASEKAVEKAIEMMKPGIRLDEIGKAIESVIKSYGFRPIENLTGHGVERGILHTTIPVPNVSCTLPYEIKEGEHYAIEPFATSGIGYVIETPDTAIYSLVGVKPLRMNHSRELLNLILEKYEMMPFTDRWIDMPALRLKTALSEMLRNEVLRAYPALREKANGMVAQTEHTVVIEHDSAKVLTR